MANGVDSVHDAEERIILDTIPYTCITEVGGDFIEFECVASKRLDTMKERGVDLTRPFAYAHPRRDNPNRYAVNGSDGDLIEDLKRRLASR